MAIFEEILIEKRMYDERARDENSNQLQKCLMEGKEKAKEEVGKWVESFIGWVRNKGQQVCEDVDSTFG